VTATTSGSKLILSAALIFLSGCGGTESQNDPKTFSAATVSSGPYGCNTWADIYSVPGAWYTVEGGVRCPAYHHESVTLCLQYWNGSAQNIRCNNTGVVWDQWDRYDIKDWIPDYGVYYRAVTQSWVGGAYKIVYGDWKIYHQSI
jgi:hypothetical protein